MFIVEVLGASQGVSPDSPENSATVEIIDDDRMSKALIPSYISIQIWLLNTGVTLGFQQTSYTVRESASSLQVCVEMIGGEAAIPVQVTLMTGPPGNAEGNVLALQMYAATYTFHFTGVVDFISLSDVSLVFTGANGVECVDIFVLDDETVEVNETFSVLLTSSNSAVDIGQNSATVAIIDDDTSTVGWSSLSYTVVEDSGSAIVCAEIINGEIARPITVLYTTMDGTTQGSYNALL